MKPVMIMCDVGELLAHVAAEHNKSSGYFTLLQENQQTLNLSVLRA